MTDNSKSAKALTLYISGRTPKEIAEVLSVPTDNVYKWIKRGDWTALHEKSQAIAALKYINALLDKEKATKPEETELIALYQSIVINALTNPTELVKKQIAKSVKEIEKLLLKNLV